MRMWKLRVLGQKTARDWESDVAMWADRKDVWFEWAQLVFVRYMYAGLLLTMGCAFLPSCGLIVGTQIYWPRTYSQVVQRRRVCTNQHVGVPA